MLGHGHLHGDQQVAGAVLARHAMAPDPEGAARAGPRGDAQRHRAVEGRHRDRGPQGRLREGEGHGEGEVLAPPPEQLVLAHVHHHVEVTWRSIVAPRAAPPLDAYALAVVDAGGDAHLHPPGTPLDAAAHARRARGLDLHPRAAADAAGLAEGEQTLVLGGDAPSAARRADHR